MPERKRIHVKKYKRFKNNRWEDVTDHYRDQNYIKLSKDLMKDIKEGKAIKLEILNEEQKRQDEKDELYELNFRLEMCWSELDDWERQNWLGTIGILGNKNEKYSKLPWDKLPASVKKDISSDNFVETLKFIKEHMEYIETMNNVDDKLDALNDLKIVIKSYKPLSKLKYNIDVLQKIESLPKYKRNNTDKIKGGLGDGLPDEMFDPKELRKGIKIEMEHTNDPKIALEITKDHLTEFPEGYYDGLKELEKKLEKKKQRDKYQWANYISSLNKEKLDELIEGLEGNIKLGVDPIRSRAYLDYAKKVRKGN